MDNSRLLIVAMAQRCDEVILQFSAPAGELPGPLQPAHLRWMCSQIEKHAEGWPDTKLHRWIGFIQCAMLANRMLDLQGVTALFDKAKVAFAGPSCDLLDHLDPESAYFVDLGGES